MTHEGKPHANPKLPKGKAKSKPPAKGGTKQHSKALRKTSRSSSRPQRAKSKSPKPSAVQSKARRAERRGERLHWEEVHAKELPLHSRRRRFLNAASESDGRINKDMMKEDHTH